jgi:hypothetical protein
MGIVILIGQLQINYQIRIPEAVKLNNYKSLTIGFTR